MNFKWEITYQYNFHYQYISIAMIRKPDMTQYISPEYQGTPLVSEALSIAHINLHSHHQTAYIDCFHILDHMIFDGIESKSQ